MNEYCASFILENCLSRNKDQMLEMFLDTSLSSSTQHGRVVRRARKGVKHLKFKIFHSDKLRACESRKYFTWFISWSPKLVKFSSLPEKKTSLPSDSPNSRYKPVIDLLLVGERFVSIILRAGHIIIVIKTDIRNCLLIFNLSPFFKRNLF